MEYSFSIRYYVYIVTDDTKRFFEIGVAGDLNIHLQRLESITYRKGKPTCTNLLYWQEYETALDALTSEEELNRLSEKEIKKLIDRNNPGWNFLNNVSDFSNQYYKKD